MAMRDMWSGTADGLERAERELHEGIKVSGESPILLEGLAEVHLTSYEAGIKADEETLFEAEELARRISALQPDSAHSHYLHGRIERFRGSCTRAIGYWERAVAIDPDHAGSLHLLYHSYALQLGRPDIAAPLRRRVLEHDPLNPLYWISTGWYHWMSGDLEAALAVWHKLEAGLWGGEFAAWSTLFKAYVYLWQEREEDARRSLDGVLERDSVQFTTEWALLLKTAMDGGGEECREILSEESRLFLWNDPEAVWPLTSAYALAGEKDEALDWLEHCVERGWINYPLFAQRDPLLESIRGEERFTELMDRVKRDWEALGARLRS